MRPFNLSLSLNGEETTGHMASTCGLPMVSGPARDVLARICAVQADRPFQEGGRDKLRPRWMPATEFRLAFDELWRAGYVTASSQVGGARKFRLPPEIYESLLPHLFPMGAGIGDSSLNEHFEPMFDLQTSGGGAAAAVFCALRLVADEALPVTGKGLIHRRAALRLADGIKWSDEPLRELGIFSPYPADYPLTAVFMVDLLLHLELLVRGDAALVPDPSRVDDWLGLDERSMSAVLYRAISRRYGDLSPASRHFRRLILSPGYRPGTWYSVQEIIGGMREIGLMKTDDSAALEISASAWLRALAGYGLCELDDVSGELVFRWTNAKPSDINPANRESVISRDRGTGPLQGDARLSPGPSLIVQPDLEVLVQEEASFRIRWSLACFAELVLAEGMWSFRLTREQLEQAAKRGMEPGRIAGWLERMSGGKLPSSVSAALRQWSLGIGRTSLGEALLLACRTEQDADAVDGHPRLKEGLERLGSRHFAVRPGWAAKVRKELATAGMAPIEGLESGATGDSSDVEGSLHILYEPFEPAAPAPEEAEDYALAKGDSDLAICLPEPELLYGEAILSGEEPFRSPSGAGLWYSEDDLFGLQPTPPPALAAPAVLWPDYERVPSSWFHKGQKYHISTARKVMEQALEWGTKVSLTVNGLQREFIPESLQRGAWEVTGYWLDAPGDMPSEGMLTGEEWEEIALIVPSFPGMTSSSSGGACGMIE
ncbi:helicase-associated domain-containing protein [Paenibacillus sp. HN-1]|uniref:helicase-associated domain-containing protein n=1 Tax=Paenibacillus TaxID=44249 RepID=UPI001CAA092B|nr:MULTISPECIES: helicase-associated domain-containing protein [Paenibacillus]MBY9082305.1 helicase-associated domain-containing protein [Paenibacillus sp. CGMCC 1.18879]MBY9086331.1 helicase-associated domain-containing protein [Paenibacillus sinensis]